MPHTHPTIGCRAWCRNTWVKYSQVFVHFAHFGTWSIVRGQRQVPEQPVYIQYHGKRVWNDQTPHSIYTECTLAQKHCPVSCRNTWVKYSQVFLHFAHFGKWSIVCGQRVVPEQPICTQWHGERGWSKQSLQSIYTGCTLAKKHCQVSFGLTPRFVWNGRFGQRARVL